MPDISGRTQMEYVYAALLLHKLDKKIDEDSVKKVVSSTGASPDDIKIKALVSALGEVDIEEALKTQVAPAAVAQPASQSAQATESAPEKTEGGKEEKEEGKKEEALEGLSSLFG